MQLNFFLIGCVWLLAACSSPEKETMNRNFDTRTFFLKEISALKTGKKGMVKTMTYNEQTRQLILNGTVNWENELAPFLAIDLANEVFTSAFNTDTAVTEAGITITYSARDEKKELKSIVVSLAENKVLGLRFELYTQNSLYSNRKFMEYLPETGYRIQGVQHVRLLNESDYSVNARWTN